MTTQLFASHLEGMSPVILYKVLKLRSDVFVVEQDCAYSDPDGRDLEANSLQVWAEVDGEIAGAARVLSDPAEMRIGRLVTSPDHRGDGVGREVFTFAMKQCDVVRPGCAIRIDAQAYLQRWYESLGFEVIGDEFYENNIAHVPMRRPASDQ